MKLLILAAACALSGGCSSPRPASQERINAKAAPHRGILTLIARGDTTIRDEYVRDDTLLRGTVRPLIRGAKFGWARYEVHFARSGEARRAVLSIGRVGTRPDSTPVRPFTTILGPQSIVEEWPNKLPTTIAYQPETIPMFGPSIAMFQEVIRRARSLTAGEGTVTVPVYSLLSRSGIDTVRVTWVDVNTVDVGYGQSPAVRYAVDGAGNILRGVSSSGEFITTRLR